MGTGPFAVSGKGTGPFRVSLKHSVVGGTEELPVQYRSGGLRPTHRQMSIQPNAVETGIDSVSRIAVQTKGSVPNQDSLQMFYK